MNKIKQSRGININAIITALGATQNCDNSRRHASRRKKKILITLASAFFMNGQHAAACHFCSQSIHTHLCCSLSFLSGLQIRGGGLNLSACHEILIFFYDIFFVPSCPGVNVECSRKPSYNPELTCLSFTHGCRFKLRAR